MPEPFKNNFNPEMIRLMAGHLASGKTPFNEKRFVEVATGGLEELELKERSNQILEALECSLPRRFEEACEVLLDSLCPEDRLEGLSFEINDSGILGWAVMPMADYIAKHGRDDFELSMKMLREFTMRFTSEFAIRPFLEEQPDLTLERVMEWAEDENYHVRRLASEGTRPRLPWGIRLSEFDKNPKPLIPILEALKDDSEEYVRKSVANHLNDISKKHPDLVASIAKRWLKGASKNRKRLVRHGCRSLIKQGHSGTLQALGYGEPEICLISMKLRKQIVKMGESVEVGVELQSTSLKSQPLIVDYVLHHQRANGTLSLKTFKWKSIELQAGGTLEITKKNSFRKVTTRKYYEGLHRIELQVNGKRFGVVDFDLVGSR